MLDANLRTEMANKHWYLRASGKLKHYSTLKMTTNSQQIGEYRKPEHLTSDFEHQLVRTRFDLIEDKLL